MSRNALRLCTLTLLTALAATAHAAPCTKLAPTRVIYVEFAGCGRAEPGASFDVVVNGKTVTVKKANATAKYWVGEMLESFAIGDGVLTLLSDAIPRARAMCKTEAIPHRAGSCVALFRVSCEPTWQLKVETVPSNARATIRYQRKKAGDRVLDCPIGDATDPEGPGELVLSRSEGLLVRVGKRDVEVEIPLAFTSFSGVRKELRISDVRVNHLSARAAVPASDALAAMGKAALQKIVTDMLFTKKGED